MIERIKNKLNLNIDTNGITFNFLLENDTLLIGNFITGKFQTFEHYKNFITPVWEIMKKTLPNVRFFALKLNEKNKDLALKIFEELFYLNFSYKKYELKFNGNSVFIDLKNNVNAKFDQMIIVKILVLLGIKDGFTFSTNHNQEVEIPVSKPKPAYQQNQNNHDNVVYTVLNLEELPFTTEMLERFFSNPSVEGKIIALEDKRIPRGISYNLTLTNYKESVYVKYFTKQELSFNIGDAVKVSGKMQYDTYLKKIVLNANKIEKSEKKFNESGLEFSENEPLRAELHVHSEFDTQDAIPSVEEYFKNAKDLGISALAVTDKENVQNFFEAEKYAKKYDVKPIYGTELKVINDKNFKVFYERGKHDKTYVGLDIETTGLSNIFDHIIEVSAFKVVDGKTLEYSKLVKLDDYDDITEISEFTTELTSITNEMLKKDGENICDVLSGLVDFIGDGIIVAHNAGFDVPFIERKIKQYLGREIRYSYIDTLNFAKCMYEARSYTLDKVAQKLKISLTQHHRAIYDAKCCLDIFYKLMGLISRTPIDLIPSNNDEEIMATIRTTSQKSYDFLYDLKNIKIINSEHDVDTKACYEHLVSLNHKNIDLLIDMPSTCKVVEVFKENEIYHNNLNLLNEIIKTETYLKDRAIHITVLVKNQKGLKELYKLISLSHTKRIYSHGVCVFLSDILDNNDLRENILIGSSCSSGIFKKIYLNGFKENFPFDMFDYFEIQPKEAYYNVDRDITDERISKVAKSIIKYANRLEKLVIFDTDAHYLNKNDVEIRQVMVNTSMSGGVSNNHKNAYRLGENPLYSTSKLIEKMASDYELDSETVKAYVCDNSLELADLIEEVNIAPTKLYIPTETFLQGKKLDVLEGKNIENIKDEFMYLCNKALDSYRYNGILPEYIQKRADREIKSITENGYHIIYYISYLLVKKSNMDGYVVGSRGSVGSSFVANLMGITEVNALKPHYRCPHCHYQMYKDVDSFIKIDEHKERILRENLNNVSSGFDLEDAVCPICGEKLAKDGQDIPFETFLGFDGDKVPDIDLNFASVYQSTAHLFTKELFGENNVVRAGTISKFADKTAYNLLKSHYEETISDAEIERRANKILNVKRTTGQHASGIVIIPEGMEYEDFVPVQYPANKTDAWITTHFDYKSIHDNLLKLDILGHVDPTVLKALMEEVAKNPEEYPFKTIKEIPFCDKKIFELLRRDGNDVVNALGISEFGTKFVMGMLKEIDINSFADLVKVSGLSHGTDVWQNNSQVLVSGNSDFGKIPFKDVIGCRDDIMVQLLDYKLEPKDAFDIMEFVRKGKVAGNPEKWAIYKEKLEAKGVPAWYIWSLSKIKYMFPKAHAVAYVMSALRIAWFKAYKPLVFYKVYMSIRDKKFDTKNICTNDLGVINNVIEKYSKSYDSKVDLEKVDLLMMAREMLSKGYTFIAPSINHSHSTEFKIVDDTKLLVPFNKINGVGDEIANTIYNNRGEFPYLNLTDLKERGKANKKFIDGCEDLSVLTFD